MNDTIWTIIAAALLIILMIGNRKVRLKSLLSKQIQVFRNARTNKISIWDLLCFIVFPICLALIVAYVLGICIPAMERRVGGKSISDDNLPSFFPPVNFPPFIIKGVGVALSWQLLLYSGFLVLKWLPWSEV